MIVSKIIKVLILSSPLLFACILRGEVGVIHMVMLVFFSMFLLNKYEASVILLMCLPQLTGIIFPFFNIPITGALFCLLVSICLLGRKIGNIYNKKNIHSLVYIFILLLFLTVAYVFSGESNYSSVKISNIYITTCISIIVFSTLKNFSDINSEKLSVLFLLSSILVYAIAYNIYAYAYPESLLYFDSFRSETVARISEGRPYISYHVPSLLACLSLSFLLGNKIKMEFLDFLHVLTILWIIMMSGARQGLFIFVIIFCIWLMIDTTQNFKTKILVAIALSILFFVILFNFEVEYISSRIADDSNVDTLLNRNLTYPLELIKKIPLLGVGFGNYHNPYTGEIYPHNMILEIIIELGYIGLTLIVLLCAAFFINNRFDIRQKLPNGVFVIFLVLPYLMRSLISLDLGANIVVFVAIFILNYREDKHSINRIKY
jgi:O-antigen ligase